MRLLPAFLVLLAGCASTPALTRGTDQTVVSGGGGTLGRSGAEPAPQDSLPIGPELALRALMRAYESMDIAVTLVDPKKMQIGNPALVVRRTLGGSPLSRFVNCGSGMTGLHADTDRIYLSVISAATATPAGSLVETRVQAESQDITAGASADRVPCETTGALELQLHRRAGGKSR
ncbi:MAG TPA: hypothetical protein VNA89_13195 [Gemmatimonadaceae bacterium]|nr:hypothetical protein [Gemmatimonadaceae bacterium]